jgi:signal transduction histidine kinase
MKNNMTSLLDDTDNESMTMNEGREGSGIYLKYKEWNKLFGYKGFSILVNSLIVISAAAAGFGHFNNPLRNEIVFQFLFILIIISSLIVLMQIIFKRGRNGGLFVVVIYNVYYISVSIGTILNYEYYWNIPILIMWPVVLYFINSIVLFPKWAIINNTILLIFALFDYVFYATSRDGSWGYGMLVATTGLVIATVALVAQHVVVLIRERATEQMLQARHSVEIMQAEMLLENERQYFQQEFNRLNRIEMIEALSTTLAHEVKQPIASALAFAESALNWVNLTSDRQQEAARALQGVIDQILRANDVVVSIREMTVRTHLEPAETEVITCVNSVLRVMRAELDLLGIALDFAPATWGSTFHVRANDLELQQVVMNLLMNAMDALRDQPGPRLITIELQLDRMGWIELAIEDNGPGIPEGQRDSIFKPYFTTKHNGTGLGLVICRNLIERYGGGLEINPNRAGGVSAVIRLPLAAEADLRTAPEVPFDPPLAPNEP